MSSPPSTLGQYQIIREIARSNDIVYEAYDPLMNRRVAVKELAMPPGSTPQQREDRTSRFKREAQAAGTLNHANIMTVYSFAEDAGRIFMAMEYLDGQTLRSEMDAKGTFTTDRAVEVATSVLAGLDHAHSKGVIHRDIKPDNVQVLSNKQIKITDFGIARLTFQPNLTMDGQVFGTPSYMSPEQVVGRDIDQRSDLFSVGVLLYEMLTGTKPFPGDSVVTITYAIMNRDPDRPMQIPYPLWEVIEKSMAKSPAMRYGSATEMSRALENAVRGGYNSLAANQPSNQTAYGQSAYAPPQNYPAAPPPQQTPYNTPYVPQQQPYAPPVNNPYGAQSGGPIINQVGQMPPSVPITYPYNPYQPQPMGHPMQGQMGMPAPGPIPVYYPPPPRQPLLKPDTVVFLKKLGTTFLVLGTLFALFLVGGTAFVQAINRYSAEQELVKRENQLVSIDPNTPVLDQIREWEAFWRKIPDGLSKDKANKNLGALYERLAADAIKGGRLEEAEANLNKGKEYDQHSPQLNADLGALFQRQVANQADPSARADLYRQSAESYNVAYSQETQAAKKAEYGQQIVESAYNYAFNALKAQNPDLIQNARQTLQAARAYANGADAQKVDDLLRQMSG